MVSYVKYAGYSFVAGTVSEILRPTKDLTPLGAFPYRFDAFKRSKDPIVVGVFQKEYVTSVHKAQTFDVEQRIALSQVQSFVQDELNFQDPLPSHLIHVGYDPETLHPEMLKHILSDPLERLAYSPLAQLPDFRKKMVDIADEQRLLDEWVCIDRDMVEVRDSKASERREELLPFVRAQVQRWKPYGLTFLEFARWGLFEEVFENRRDSQKD